MKKFVVIILCVMMVSGLSAQISVNSTAEKVVTLVVSGTGITKEEATKNALRSAIEQAYGTFVSANTQVVNDELVKDEIATVSSGNIQKYEELSSTNTSNGIDVTLKVTVSPEKLISFAKSKGMKTELAGASFVMNMKMRELNRKNEIAAIGHMIEKAALIARNGLFDYKLEIGEPKLGKDSRYAVKLKILFCENANTIEFYKTIYQTLQALSLSEKEQQEYRNIGLNFYNYDANFDKSFFGIYSLRNEYPSYEGESPVSLILPIVVNCALNYIISDNLGNKIYSKRRYMNPSIRSTDLENYIDKGHKTCIWYYLDSSKQTLHFYELNPQNRIKPYYSDTGVISQLIPIKDYSNSFWSNGFRIHGAVPLNPLIDADGVERKINNPQRIYFTQEFYILYKEEELSKLDSITIEHRKN